MIKVLVAGAGGRMGGRIIAALEGQEEIALGGAFEKKGHSAVGQDAGSVSGIGDKGLVIVDRLESIIDSGDVIIDFTDPEATLRHVELVVAQEKAMVIGTTGMEAGQKDELEKAGREDPCRLRPQYQRRSQPSLQGPFRRGAYSRGRLRRRDRGNSSSLQEGRPLRDGEKDGRGRGFVPRPGPRKGSGLRPVRHGRREKEG